MERITTEFVRNIITERPADMHKGQAGRVLIIAGSKGMAGAAVLAARGALYSGAGLVKVAVPEELFNIIQITVPEAMCISREELCKACACDVAEDSDVPDNPFEGYDAIAIGPGLGVSEESHDLLLSLLDSYDGPVVMDADALNCMSRYGLTNEKFGYAVEHNGPTVITPHPSEADRLLMAYGQSSYGELGREGAAETLAQICGCVVLLKGQETIIARGSEFFVNPTGNPGMATGGSGDVLTGMIVSLLAQGVAGDAANTKHDRDDFMCADALEATCAAAFLHGLAGDIAAENIGEYGMTSADIADAISMAIREI